MPTIIDLEPAGKNKLKITVEQNGQIKANQIISYLTAKGISAGANLCGISAQEFQQYTRQLEQSGPVNFTIQDKSDAPPEPFRIWIRGLHQSKLEAKEYEFPDPETAIRTILAIPESELPPEALIYWDGKTRLCAMDMDTHRVPHSKKPTHTEMRAVMSKIQPQPVCWYPTPGDGLRAFFVETPDYTADQLAVMAGLAVKSQDGRYTLEIKADSRHPACIRLKDMKRAGPVFMGKQTAEMSIIHQWISRAADEAAVNEWLEENNYERVKRYPHERCPICPTHVTQGTPVFVGDYGIHCDSCQTHGESFNGSKRPGFVSWGQLIGGAEPRLVKLIRGWVHWGHAKRILPHLIGEKNPELLETCYRTLLQFYYGKDDPRIEMTFTAQKVMRFGSNWYKEDGLTAIPLALSRSIVSTFPATCYLDPQPDGSRKAKISQSDVDMLRVPGAGMEDRGYFDLFPNKGMDGWGVHLEYPESRFPFVMPHPLLPADRQPKYVVKGQRMSVNNAIGVIESVLPGINMPYLQYMISTIIFCQGNDQTALTFCAGYSGSGKSTIPVIAAGAMGQIAALNPFVANWERFRQGVLAQLDNTQMFVTNEIEKDCQKYRIIPKAAFDCFLNLEPGTASHGMYVGSVKIHRGFSQVCTDIGLHKDVKGDIQHGRRWVYIQLTRKVPDWKRTLNLHGVSHPSQIRMHSQELADAFNALISHIIDTEFNRPRVLEDIADSFGHKLLMYTPEYTDTMNELREFFDLVCAEPEIDGLDTKKLPGRGWKRVAKDFQESDRLGESWSNLADNRLDKWFSSAKIQAEDWNSVLKIPHEFGHVVPEVKKFNEKCLYVRFKIGTGPEPEFVNSEVFNRTPADPPGAD